MASCYALASGKPSPNFWDKWQTPANWLVFAGGWLQQVSSVQFLIEDLQPILIDRHRVVFSIGVLLRNETLYVPAARVELATNLDGSKLHEMPA